MIAPCGPPLEMTAGLPVSDALALSGLSISSSANCLVAAVGKPGVWYDQRIFVRHLSETTYREIVLPDGAMACDVVVASSLPAAFIVLRSNTDSRAPLEMLGLFRLELPGGQLLPLPGPRVANPEGHRIEVVDLLCVSDSSSSVLLQVVVSVETQASTDTAPDCWHHLATYAPATGELVLQGPMATFGA